ncbi:Hint domain-containing protein [Phyllobacterium myrsinacearum]|uniref:Hint domain-containing protein n=1 Tax=Phyllobacterium myrsinacearum TaxID=28101 RepID=UPI001029A072|nr:Hint domain-containing protein [Phyllobacterium myrsinacearum]RZS72770.1 Hint domain-containing protein [Phyllobacterium myrsinacearum]
MSPTTERHRPLSRARRHFLGVALSTSVKVAAITGFATAMSSFPARAMGRKWWRHGGEPGHTPGGDNQNCFLRGTSIRTPAGEVHIEDLRIGDDVETMNGKAAAVRWIGRQVYKRNSPSWAASVMPIRISRHAFDQQTPHADLYLSPNHALYVDGVLIRAKDLVNGLSIAPSLPPDREIIEYFHIVLDTHDVIFAEGAPAETFLLRDSNHESFTNFSEYARLYPAGLGTPMVPFAPIIGYEGGRENLMALLRLGLPRFIGLRDPVQDARDRFALRARETAGTDRMHAMA